MVGNLSGFNADEWEPNADFEALPAGEYTAIIVESGFEPTKAAKESGKDEDGQFLKLKLQVVDGPFKNRTLFDRLNLVNPNETAVQIAKGTLSAICRAIGRMTPKDSSELHNRPLTIRVAQEPYNGSVSNKVKAYKPVKAAGGEPEAPSDEPATQEPAAASRSATVAGKSGNKAPWARR